MDDFVSVRRVTADSVPGRCILEIVRVVRRAWTHSRLRTLLQHANHRLNDESLTERTQLAAVVVAVGAAVNLAARIVITPYSAPGIPVGLLIAVAVVAAAVAAAPGAFIAAWRDSRFRRSKQR